MNRTKLSSWLLLACGLWFAHGAVAQAQFPEREFPLSDHKNISVDLGEFTSGGPPKDGIPSVDKPVFVDTATAGKWIKKVEPVIALKMGDDARAYPLQIMMYHEIVNDVVDGKPVAVTFCPLCNASIVFDRTVNGSVLDFGTTGRLRLSDLVMYDRQTESWWQQFNGVGLLGEYNEVRLEQINSQIVSFADFVSAFPDGKVLSRDTGYQRSYGRNPYAGYDNINNNPFLFFGEHDKRLPPMERVLSIGVKEETLLVPVTPLNDKPVLNISVEQEPIAVFAASTATSALDRSSIAKSRLIPAAAAFSRQVGEKTLTFSLQDGVIVDQETGSRWNAFGLATEGVLKGSQLEQRDRGVHFAFAWLAFDPDADIVSIR